MKITVVRGAFTNPFEMQSYEPLTKKLDIQVISSKSPINSDIKIPVTKLSSLTDLPNFPYKFPILNRLFVDAHYLFGLEKAITGSDIVHVAETYYHYTHQAIEAKKKGLIKRIVSTVWEVISHNNEGIKGRSKFKSTAYQYIDKFICVTKKAQDALIEEGVDPKKTVVIPVGIDLQRFAQKTKNAIRRLADQKRKSEGVNILCVSRLVEEKGIGELISAFKKIRENNKNLTLTFVGDGPLKKLIKGVEGIIHKSLPYRQIHKIYQQADIFCLPSKTTKYWQEQFGMVLLEAMACGLPIVTTNTGAIKEVCARVALYAKPANPDDLQSKLEQLIKNPTLRLSIGRSARLRAANYFDKNKIAQKIYKVYQELCPSKKP